MGTLTPEAVVQHWKECLDYARESQLGIFGAQNSRAFIDRVNSEYDRIFVLEPAVVEWQAARLAVCASKINTPECAVAITRLGHAEDALSKIAVEIKSRIGGGDHEP